MQIKHNLSVNSDTKRIPLGGKRGAGLFALVDAEDFEFLSRFSWHLAGGKYGIGPATNRGSDALGLRTKFRMSRAVLLAPPGLSVCHKNGDTFDCRRSNLVLCTSKGVAEKRTPHGRSDAKGVTWHKQAKRWQAAITSGGESHYLGLYQSKEEAIEVADRAIKHFHREMPRCNRPESA